ncbi:hypothetical protein CBR_g2836 [Chara braunii]|uniref:non-specific serine/threonine protein kinase n=1 Tax=Chara braunii TaxID=69332 RepID=A0A388KE11_CHABU|nr:hypothetical protein CBR_g2836 [Chara braunii]|eukprot:GBG68289.1 hypothetical protein CBR_g2836 [Chara braunii]
MKSPTGSEKDVEFEDPTMRYELLNELGKGSYGAVYKARDLHTSELVAIKVISLSEAEEGYEEIRGEIEMLQQCNHPNVVRYLGSYQGDDYLWIVMEYCGGSSVADLINVTDEPLEEVQIAYICREALKGLAYLHSIFKVHRDIKCGNILMTEQGEIKLGDFGVAAQLTRTMSKRNTFIGTPHWMAPEVIQESRYDGKVDVWALGISGIEMAEGLPPRSNIHPMRVIFMISREPPPMLEDKEKWSLVFHDFVAKSLTKEPRSRPTATQMLQHKFIDKCKATAACMLPNGGGGGGSNGLAGGTLRAAQTSISGLQDKMISVYAAGNTIPIPFLRATDVSPIALLSPGNNPRAFGALAGNAIKTPEHSGRIALDALQQLYSSGGGIEGGGLRRGKKPMGNEPPLPPSTYRRLATSSTLGNLARAMAYHKHCADELPLLNWQLQQEEQIINNLSDILRTILRL